MDKFLIKKIRRGYIVVNKDTGGHTHVRSKYGACCILKLIREGIEPYNTYLKESCRRITEEKKDYKDRYINVAYKGIQK